MSPKRSPETGRRGHLLVVGLALVLTATALALEPSPRSTSGGEKVETFRVHESWGTIWVDTHAPYSPEIENETQSRELAKEAATVVGQDSILRYVLKKRTAKGRTLDEAQIPSTDIQNRIQALIKGAQVSNVRFAKDGCRLRVSVLKKNLKIILRKS